MSQTSIKNGAPIAPGKTRIGFVGIGNMGTPMASRLLKAGWTVQVYDIDKAKVARFTGEHGGSAAETLEELGRNADLVITMVLDGKIVSKVLLGEAGGDCVLRSLAMGSLIIDMSSSAPLGTRELGAELDRRGMLFMDAPVSGGVKGAVAGTLAIMTGGEQELAARCDALFAVIGRRMHVGPLGSGHAAKALNNYVSAAGLAAACEALIVAQRFGIDPTVMTAVLNASSGRNNSTENKMAQFILSRTWGAGFALGLMAKDLGLAMEVARELKVPAELGHACLKVWKDAEAALGGKADHTEIVKYLGDLR